MASSTSKPAAEPQEERQLSVLDVAIIEERYKGWQILRNYGELTQAFSPKFPAEVMKGFWHDMVINQLVQIDDFEALTKYHLTPGIAPAVLLSQRILWLSVHQNLSYLQGQLIQAGVWPDGNNNLFLEKMFLVLNRDRTMIKELKKASAIQGLAKKGDDERKNIDSMIRCHFNFS